jgi:ornithine carbamoyltransferase
MFRALKAADVELAASFNRIPVIDACSEKYHPAQALSDLLTMSEKSGGVENIKKIAWLGMEGNVSASLMLVATKLGIEFAIATPRPDAPDIDGELDTLATSAGVITRTTHVSEALRNAQFVHTDTWMNMEFFDQGQIKKEFQAEYEKRKQKLLPYQLNAALINAEAPSAGIMHCMPCHIGYEISRDAINHPNSHIFDQAENRLHMQKAIMLWLLEKEHVVLE